MLACPKNRSSIKRYKTPQNFEHVLFRIFFYRDASWDLWPLFLAISMFLLSGIDTNLRIHSYQCMGAVSE